MTHGWWKLGPKRERAEYALAVGNGVVRGVWVVRAWRPRVPEVPSGTIRLGFDGEPSEELRHLVGLDVSAAGPPDGIGTADNSGR